MQSWLGEGASKCNSIDGWLLGWIRAHAASDKCVSRAHWLQPVLSPPCFESSRTFSFISFMLRWAYRPHVSFISRKVYIILFIITYFLFIYYLFIDIDGYFKRLPAMSRHFSLLASCRFSLDSFATFHYDDVDYFIIANIGFTRLFVLHAYDIIFILKQVMPRKIHILSLPRIIIMLSLLTVVSILWSSSIR